MNKINLNRWCPELRRAVIAVRPEFFSWHPDQRKQYGVMLPESDRAAITKLLLIAIAGKKGAQLAVMDDDERLPLDTQNQLNERLLPLVGVGEDSFYLNEYLGDNLSILNFSSLRAYDEYDHDFQENARAEEIPAYERRPYLGTLYGCWARALVDNRLVYLTLSMASGYVYDQISEAAADELQRLIPHRHVSGPDDGKIEDGMTRWDMRIEAGGQEALLEELQTRIWDYERQRWTALRAEYDTLGKRQTYTIDTSAHGESSLRVIFSEKEALDAIYFETFMSDCRKLAGDIEELNTVVVAEVEKIRAYIAEQHAELLRDSDPKITRLRQRKKILMHPRAFDDLNEIE